MKTAPQLKQLIAQIAQKHAFGLDQTGAYLRLDLREERLIIENIGALRISIAYQLFLLDQWMSDPEIVVWTDYKPTIHSGAEEPAQQWVPIELYEFMDGWKACAEIDPNGNMVAFYRHEWQAWLAEYTETVVVPNLISQDWLVQGVKSDAPPPSYTLAQMRERGYLIEETYPCEMEVDDGIPF